jgi:hypothetical protein
MSDELPTADALLAREFDGPFGPLRRASSRAQQPFSLAGRYAAENLLSKARRALRETNDARARSLVERAAGLPFDEHEQEAPAAMVAHMELFELVSDALGQSEENDSRWLEAVVETAEHGDESARFELRSVLAAIRQDYQLERRERAHIDAVMASLPDRGPLYDLRLEASELCDAVLSTLRACERYESSVRTVPRSPR